MSRMLACHIPALVMALVLLGCRRDNPPTPANAGAAVSESAEDKIDWQVLPGRISWGVMRLSREPTVVRVYIRNDGASTRRIPEEIYRGPSSGGPALLAGVRLLVKYAPFDPRSPHRFPDLSASYSLLPPKHDRHFPRTSRTRLLNPGETVPAFTLDLREIYPVDSPGYYEFYFKFDGTQLGEPFQSIENESGHTFTIGTPPRKLTLEELNESIPPLGDQNAEARLRKMIHTEVPASMPFDVRHVDPRPGVEMPTPKNRHFAAFICSTILGGGIAGGGSLNQVASDTTRVFRANWQLVGALEYFDRSEVREELERRLRAETSDADQAFLAALAAKFDSEAGAIRLLERMRDTDIDKARNTLAGLEFLLDDYGQRSPDWLVELALGALADERYATADRNDTRYSRPVTLGEVARSEGRIGAARGMAEAGRAIPLAKRAAANKQ